MTEETIKVVIPMAGLGTRLRPHTWSKPKQLITVAGKTVLDHVLKIFQTHPHPEKLEFIMIVGYLGEQIEEYLRKYYPNLKSHFILQENPRGQSHAISLARSLLNGPMFMIFADTLIESDLGTVVESNSEAIAWVKEVPDPRRFGVAEIGPNGWVKRLVEKPQDPSNNLVVVGFYYFKDSEALLSAIDEQISQDLNLKGEYFLADAINIMLQRGLKMQVEPVTVWLDAGTPEALLQMNQYLLDHNLKNGYDDPERKGVVTIPPVFMHPSAQVNDSIIGPYVSIGANCQVTHSIIENSILEDEAQATGVILEGSLVGRRARISRRAGIVNAGDSTEVIL